MHQCKLGKIAHLFGTMKDRKLIAYTSMYNCQEAEGTASETLNQPTLT